MKKTILLSSLILPTFLLANTTVANITSLKGKADIEYKSKLIPAKIKDELIQENNLLTYEDGFAQILFKDETIVSVGKNSNFSIEEYLGLETEKPHAQFSLVKGAMRVITGQIGKANPKLFKIKTKSATIGIRGTNFLVISVPGEGDMVICTQGGIYVSGLNTNEHYVQKGYMTRLDANGNVEGVKPYTSSDLDVVINTVFNKVGTKTTSSEELLTFFDNLFDEDPTNDDERKEIAEDEEEKTGESGKVYIGEDTGLETDNIKIIPVEDTIVVDEEEDERIDYTQDNVDEVVQNEVQSDNTEDVKPIDYIYGKGSTVTTVNDTNIVNYYNKLGLSLAIDPNDGTFSQDSIAVDSRTDTIFTFNTEMDTYTSTYDFSGTFSTNNFNNDGSTYSVQNGSYIRTTSDLDANDEVTWGEWSLPVDITKDSVTTSEVWKGNFIVGKYTPSSVISSYAQANLKGDYTGSLIGQAFEIDSGSILTTSYTGTAISKVDFGASTVDTTLTFSVRGSDYNQVLNDTISGNKFSGSNSSGAFYGSDGKTLAGEYNFEDATNQRQLTGVFQAKNNLLTNGVSD